MKNENVIFIIGSARSGTTLLGDILDKHNEITRWYEPYFVMDKYFRYKTHDNRNSKDASKEIKKYIKGEFEKFYNTSKSKYIIDKSPRNSLKIPFLLEIFPGCKFIHIVRDGRDSAISIFNQWELRKKTSNNKNIFKTFSYFYKWASKQKNITYMLRALFFELKDLFLFEKSLTFKRWDGLPGWGTRFKNWNEYYLSHSLLEFCSYQWLKSVENIDKDWNLIEDKNKILIRYEDLLADTKKELITVFEFLNLDYKKFDFSNLKILNNNFNKWKKISKEDLNKIENICKKKLIEYEYF